MFIGLLVDNLLYKENWESCCIFDSVYAAVPENNKPGYNKSSAIATSISNVIFCVDTINFRVLQSIFWSLSVKWIYDIIEELSTKKYVQYWCNFFKMLKI